MMNARAMGGIVAKVAPGVNKWFPDLQQLETVLPSGTIDHSANSLYPEVGNSWFCLSASVSCWIKYTPPLTLIALHSAATKMGGISLGGKEQICQCDQGSCGQISR
jgi:hypothetical protein